MAQIEQRKTEGITKLKEVWKGDFEKNIGLAQRGAELAGVDPQSPGFGDPNVVIAFTALMSRTVEDKLIRGGEGLGALRGAALADDIQTNPQNPMHQKYREGDEETVRYVRALRTQK